MITIILFFLIISSGSVLGSAVYGKKYEEMLPITIMSIVMLLFLCGILHVMKFGVLLVLALCAMVYAYSVYMIAKKKKIKSFMKNIATPACVIFLFFFMFFIICDRGMLLHIWDEFSHWGDIVKVMVIWNDFGTNPQTNAVFGVYPPAMALFQYFLQVLNNLIHGSVSIVEWLLYFAYKIFAVSLFMPLLKDLSFKKIPHIIFTAVCIMIIPLPFYNNFYSQIYIDSFLGILTGAGMAYLFIPHEKDGYEILFISLITATLVLSKASGTVFAIYFGIIMFIRWCSTIKKKYRNKLKVMYKDFIVPVAMTSSILLPRFLWNHNVSLYYSAGASASPSNFQLLMSIVLRTDTTYRTAVIINFIKKFLQNCYTFYVTNITISYYFLTVLFIVAIFAVYSEFKKIDMLQLKDRKNLSFSFFILVFLYIVGLGTIYVLYFSEYEALALASYDRYMNVIYLALWIVVMISVIYLSQRIKFSKKTLIGIALLLIVFTPINNLGKYITRNFVHSSVELRASYDVFADKIKDNCDVGAHFFFVSQGDLGFDYWIMRYDMKPYSISQNYSWRVGTMLIDENDMYTSVLTAEQFKAELLSSTDYVILFKVDEKFISDYASLFEDPSTIRDQTLYSVNKETGMLEYMELD